MNGDVPDGIADVSVKDEEEYGEMRDKIAGLPGVSQAYGLSWHNVSVSGRETFTFYTDRPEYLECGVYEGTMTYLMSCRMKKVSAYDLIQE